MHNFAASAGALLTPEAQEIFAEQMNGKPSPDDLGSTLPPGVPAATLAALIVPPGDKAPVGLVGAKPWAALPGRYVALVCTGGYGPSKTAVDGCAGGKPATPLHAYLAVVEIDAAGKPRLSAPPVVVTPQVDWRMSLLPNAPEAVESPVPDDPADLLPSAYDRLEVTGYRFAPGQPAFGLRAAWIDGYAGGFGWHGATLVYMLMDGRLRRVLAIPMASLTFLAGDWHRDGTRSHDILEGANRLFVGDHFEAGHADLMVRNVLTNEARYFRWNAASADYQVIADMALPTPVRR